MKAAGNYAEVRTVDGVVTFVHSPLARLKIAAPLMRVHRSYVVNLAHALRLVAKTGSRYYIEFADGASIPVGRALVEKVRIELAGLKP